MYNMLSGNSGPIASIFWQNEEYASGLGAQIRLDSVICVVDAVFGLKVTVPWTSVFGCH
jgi:hypothetical protein